MTRRKRMTYANMRSLEDWLRVKTPAMDTEGLQKLAAEHEAETGIPTSWRTVQLLGREQLGWEAGPDQELREDLRAALNTLHSHALDIEALRVDYKDLRQLRDVVKKHGQLIELPCKGCEDTRLAVQGLADRMQKVMARLQAIQDKVANLQTANVTLVEGGSR